MRLKKREMNSKLTLMGSQQIQSHSTKKKCHQHLRIIKLAKLLKFGGIFILVFTLSRRRIIF